MDEALIKRVLPHSIEGEQSVIGSMLMDREAIITASEIVTADDFYQHQYGIMFESMIELFNEGKPVDLVTLQNRLKEKDVPPEISSLEFVRDIITTVPTTVIWEGSLWRPFWQTRKKRFLISFRAGILLSLSPYAR